MLARPRWALAALLAIIGVSLAFVSIQVESYTRLSPIDELSHLDYFYRSPALLSPGDKVEQQAMHEQACRGVDAQGFDPIKCNPRTVYDADIYQEHGYNTAATNTPIYYATTRAVAEVVKAMTPTDSLFVAGRLVSGLWLALALLLTYVAGRRAGIAPAPLLVVLALLPASPAVVYASATITPDAMGLAAGALVTLVALAWRARPDRLRLALLVLACVVVSLIKITNIVVVAAIAFYLLFEASRDRERDADAPVGVSASVRRFTAVGIGAAALFATAAWTLFSNSRNHADPNDVPDMTVRFAVTEFPWNGMLDSALSMVQPLSQPWVAVGNTSLMWFTSTVVSLVLLAGVGAAAFFSTGTPRATLMARCLLAAAVLGSLGLVTMGYVTASQYFALPPRYGVALVAPMALVTASMLRTRTQVLTIGALAAVVLVMAGARLIGLP